MLGSHANLAGVIGRVISDSRTALKRVQVSLVFRLSKAITKHSKYGLTVLVLPSCLVKTDLTIHLDIPRNPGPKRAGNAAGPYPNNRLQNLLSRSLNLIKYSRSELSHLTSRHPISDDLFRKIKSMDILRTRRGRSGHVVRNRTHNIVTRSGNRNITFQRRVLEEWTCIICAQWSELTTTSQVSQMERQILVTPGLKSSTWK